MAFRSLMLHVLLCLALVANGAGAAWAGIGGDCCDHTTHATAPQSMPCHDGAMPMPPSDAVPAHAHDRAPAHDMPGHAPRPAPPHGAPHPCDGHCVCMTHAAGALPPVPSTFAATPAHDAFAGAPVRPHAPPALPLPLRPPIRA